MFGHVGDARFLVKPIIRVLQGNSLRKENENVVPDRDHGPLLNEKN
jgi:hypothetical protein